MTTPVLSASTVFERGRLTDWLLNGLLAPPLAGLETPVLVGDSEAPKEGGWSGAQPGQGTFVPYITLSTGQAGPDSRQSIGPGTPRDWNVNYVMRSVGSLREQCDWVADQARKAWGTYRDVRLPLGDGPQWKLYGFAVVQMGPVTRNDTVNPPYWEVLDQLLVKLTR